MHRKGDTGIFLFPVSHTGFFIYPVSHTGILLSPFHLRGILIIPRFTYGDFSPQDFQNLFFRGETWTD